MVPSHNAVENLKSKITSMLNNSTVENIIVSYI